MGSYAFELFSAVADLDAVYVPIGCGSGICGLISWRDALGLKTKIIGAVSAALLYEFLFIRRDPEPVDHGELRA